MKFTRYLEDTQTPEWKRAYIDYRVFKDMIRAIRRAQDGMALNPVESYSNSQINRPAASMLSAILQSESGDHSSQTSSIHLPIERRDLTFIDVPSRERAGVSGHNSTDRQQRRPSLRRTPTPQNNVAPPSPGGALASPQLLTRQLTNRSHLAPPSAGGDAATSNSRHLKTSAVPQLIIRQWTNNSQSRQVHGDGMPSSPVSRIAKSFSQFVNPMRRHPYSELSLNSLMLLLSPPELAFFSVLDAELQKVESFYLEREKAMQLRTRDLEAQVNELNEHKKLFDANHRPEASLSWTARLNAAWTFGRQSRSVARTEVPAIVLEEPTSTALPVEGLFSGNTKTEETRDHGQGSRRLNPKEYLAARRKLKRAVLEHYRGLEMLHNYRVTTVYINR
ncbi:SPX domain-containing protein [Mycena rebaudengoi]|nr:SPX domain-containing protein [Mycena rebaudengoi]